MIFRMSTMDVTDPPACTPPASVQASSKQFRHRVSRRPDATVRGVDLDNVVSGIEFVRSLQKALDGYMEEEETPGPAVQTRDDLKQFVKDNAWGHHASCTCKIGPREAGGVVDSKFRRTALRIVKSLR